MFIPDPGSWFLPILDPGSRISDPGSKNSNKREGWKKNFCHTFLCSHKFHKIKNYFSFKVLKKKIWANFQRITELFTQKIVTKLSKIWLWDPGSEIRDPEKTYSGSRIQGSKRHRILDPDPQHWLKTKAKLEPSYPLWFIVFDFLSCTVLEEKDKRTFYIASVSSIFILLSNSP